MGAKCSKNENKHQTIVLSRFCFVIIFVSYNNNIYTLKTFQMAHNSKYIVTHMSLKKIKKSILIVRLRNMNVRVR